MDPIFSSINKWDYETAPEIINEYAVIRLSIYLLKNLFKEANISLDYTAVAAYIFNIDTIFRDSIFTIIPAQINNIKLVF